MQRWLPIKTKRLLLREINASDLANVHEYASDPLVSRFEFWGPNPPDVTEKVVQGWLTQQQQWPREEANLGIELIDEHKLIGVITLRMKNDANRNADFGFAFNRQYWNQGSTIPSVRQHTQAQRDSIFTFAKKTQQVIIGRFSACPLDP